MKETIAWPWHISETVPFSPLTGPLRSPSQCVKSLLSPTSRNFGALRRWRKGAVGVGASVSGDHRKNNLVLDLNLNSKAWKKGFYLKKEKEWARRDEIACMVREQQKERTRMWTRRKKERGAAGGRPGEGKKEGKKGKFFFELTSMNAAQSREGRSDDSLCA